MKQGLFVTIEGCEGAGKSTQCTLLASDLEQRGYPTLTAREPGGTYVSEQIRRVLLDPGNIDITPRVELLLFLASRAQLVHQVIIPALEQGSVVISDRFHHSTLAYQGGARGLGLDEVGRVNSFATGGAAAGYNVSAGSAPGSWFYSQAGNRCGPDGGGGDGVPYKGARNVSDSGQKRTGTNSTA